jgi:hypothetical protein
MSIVIAGRQVEVGNSLYHTGFKAWGVVTGFDPSGPALLELNAANNQKTTLFVQNGGIINGARVIYWHAPLVLDLPTANITKYQTLLNALVQNFGEGS